MLSWFEGLKTFFGDPNNRNFALGLLALFIIFYVLQGETGAEKLQRFFKVLLLFVLLAFIYGMYYFFIKN